MPIIRLAWGNIFVLLLGLCSDLVEESFISGVISEYSSITNIPIRFTSLYSEGVESEIITPWKDIYEIFGTLMYP